MHSSTIKHTLRFPAISMLFILTQFSTSVYLPIMPRLTDVFHASSAQIMATLAYSMSGYAIGQLFWGGLSDRYGRKPLILSALICYALTALAMIHLHTIFAFSIVFMLLGFFFAAPTSIGHAMIRDLYGQKGAKKPIATLGVLMASGPFVGPIIGAHLYDYFGWTSIFIFLCIYGLINALALYWLIPETRTRTSISHRGQHDALIHIYLSRFRNKRYSAYVLILSLSFASMYVLLQQAPFIFIERMGYSEVEFSWMFGIISSLNVIGALINRHCIQKTGAIRMVKIGIIFLLLSGVSMMYALYSAFNGLYPLMISCSLLMFGVGFCAPATKAGAMITFEDNAGASASVMKFTQLLFVTLFSVLGAHLSDAQHGDELAFMVLTAACLAAGLSFYLKKPKT